MAPVLQRRPRLLAIGIASAVFLNGCGRAESEQPPAARRPISVNTVATAMTERAERLEAGGVVAAAETAVVSSRVVAPVTAVRVRADDRVRAGDELVRLDAREMTARVHQSAGAVRAAEEALNSARSTHAAAAAEHQLAAAWHARIATLRERNAATAQELDEADARLAGAAARMAAAQANVEEATAHLTAIRADAEAAAVTESYAVLRAPFDGEVTERLTDPGNLAAPGQPLLRLDARGARRVDVQIDEARAAYVRRGQRISVVLDDPRPAGTVLDGTVVEVARAVAADQRAFTVKVALPPGTAPRTGTFARVRFDGAPRQVLVVPTSAVRRNGQVASVFVVRAGLAHLRLVQTGFADAAGIEIVGGLEPGESVVASPPLDLVDGWPVTVASASDTGGSQ